LICRKHVARRWRPSGCKAKGRPPGSPFNWIADPLHGAGPHISCTPTRAAEELPRGPATVSADYFDAIEAPDKQLLWLERSGHLLPFEEPAAFDRLMIDAVRPYAAIDAE